MDFTLYVGDFAYSSWSLRGWLLFDAFGIGMHLRHSHMRTPAFEEMREEMTPAWLVPAVSIDHGVRGPVMVWDTLAIAETLHEYFPQAGLWPKGERVRPVSRSLAAEMHAGFAALRAACPMNMRVAYDGFPVSTDVRTDLERLDALWGYGRMRQASEGRYLFGSFSAVDAFFAPVASRVVTYDLPMGETAMTYVHSVLAHPSVRRWRAMAFADPYVQEHYRMEFPLRPDPTEPEVTGTVVHEEVAANTACPLTGGPPTHLVRIGDTVLGFETAFDRDKVAADPLAWPEISVLLG